MLRNLDNVSGKSILIISKSRICWYCGHAFVTPPCQDRKKTRTKSVSFAVAIVGYNNII